MALNTNNRLVKEERKKEGFFKVLQSADMFSENMRAIPVEIVRSFSKKELSGSMKITAQWGSSWEIGISKNPRFYFMEKSGWEKFVRDSFLGEGEYLTFIHKGQMCFSVNIFKEDGKEMVHPGRQYSMASSSRIKTEQGEEEIVVSFDSELGSLGPARARSNGREKKYKRKLSFGKNKSQKSKRNKEAVNVRSDTAGASSSSVAYFSILIKNSYLKYLPIPRSIVNEHMPKMTTTFKIHHRDMEKSWNVVYLARKVQSCFSTGWFGLAKEYPLAVGDICQFTFINPAQLRLEVLKP